MKIGSALLIALLLSINHIPARAGVFGSVESASAVEKGSARTMSKVLKGSVVQVSEAKIEESDTARGTGMMAGIGIGAAAGSGGSPANIVGGVIGAVAGGVAGAAVSAFAGSQTAQDILIQLDAGDLVNITQAVDDKVGAFAEGDAILVIYKGDSARVIRNKIGAKPAAAPAN